MKSAGFLVVLFIAVGSISIGQAAELKLVTGQVRGSCSDADEALLGDAQRVAQEKAGSSSVQVSPWKQNVGDVSHAYMPECLYRAAWAEAVFVEKSEINEPWYLTVEGGFANPRIDQDQPGQGTKSDEEAWIEAKVQAEQRANLFCRGISNTQVLTNKKKVFSGRNWYDYFSTKIRVECSR